MSSLQQALDDAATRLKLKRLNDHSGRKSQRGSGAFENSFAHGLDLSELVTTSARPSSSAAEELLKIKEEERRKRQVQEEEEVKMEEALQKRINYLKQQTNDKSKERNQQSSFDLGDALFRMHGTDDRVASMLTQKTNTRKTRVGGLASRDLQSTPKGKSRKINKKVSVSKKSRKAKF